MQCATCYDEEIQGIGINRVIRKTYLEMEETGFEKGYTFFQCPRCLSTRKRKSGFLTSGVIEQSTSEEAISAQQNSSGSVLGAIIGIGIATVVIGALASASETPTIKND